MADCCNYCEEKKPTNHLVLNGGDLWIEFCADCAQSQTLINGAGETLTLQQIFLRASGQSADLDGTVNL